jgi:hypothetical protein
MRVDATMQHQVGLNMSLLSDKMLQSPIASDRLAQPQPPVLSC